ncbi:RNA-binding protein 25 [Esox lucius]|uniref:E3 ubiquitin-protein ligase RNF180 n=1 Tax=Esox lucius TaxID=8010 RepID=A0AAY5LAU9_ESOLU|nr:RNA-binding protein 25 [Esox lucius]
MCSRLETTRVYGATGGGGVAGGEDSESEVERMAEALCLEVRPRLRYRNPVGPEINACSAGADRLGRPALPGRKAHRKALSEDLRVGDRERAGERNQDGEGDSEPEFSGVRKRESNRDRDKEMADERIRDSERERERDSQRHRGTRDQERDEARDRDRNGDREGTKEREGRRSRTQSFSNCNTNPHQSTNMEASNGERLLRGLPSPGHPQVSYQRPSTAPRSPRQASVPISSALVRPPPRIRTSTLSPRRLTQRASLTETRHCSRALRDSGAFWVEPGSGTGIGRLSPRHRNRTRLISQSSLELGEEEEEEEEEGEEEEEEERGELGGSGVLGVVTLTPAGTSYPAPTEMDRRMSKRERNRMKSLRRRQRRRERWRQSQLQENRQSSTGNPWSSSEEEDVSTGDREGFICAVCLDVYFSPYMCHPCSHIFCEPCLRTLAKSSPTNTPCPLCRTIITHVFFQKELNHTARTFFPKEYLSRKQTFQKASCAKWPLPSCRKLFRIFGGFQRQASPIARRQFPHGGYRLDAMDFEDDSRGWRFDMDMIIIYIYSVNWVIGFIVFCFLCYFFFPSF